MFKGLTGLKKAVKGGFSAVAEHSSSLAEQVVGDPSTSKDHIKESLKRKVQGGVATVVDAGENVLSQDPNNTKEKVGEVAKNIKHYGAFGEDYLGYSDPTKDLRKAVKEKEKAAKKARKAKKKKTGKKEDLFDPENLAKYKKELEEKRKREAERQQQLEEGEGKESDEEGGEHHEGDKENLKLNLAVPVDSDSPDTSAAPSPARTPIKSPNKEDTDDWKLFQNLTSGVDHLIKKTQDDLGDIKKDSYFQQKQTKLVDKTADAEKRRKLKKKKKWVDLDAASFDDFDGEVVDDKDKEEDYESETEGEDEVEEEKQEEPVQEEPEPEPEPEEKEKPTLFKLPSEDDGVDKDDDDDLFNTDFVNAITSGDVKLAVIPDDPIFDDDDDPFNTEIANVVIKKQEEIKRKEESRIKFTGLSAVADVLSGKTDKIDKSAVDVTVKRKRRRANRINLIGEEKNEVTALEDIAIVDTEKPSDQVDILGLGDDSLPVPEGDLLASTPSPCPTTPAQDSSAKKDSFGIDLSEFETIAPTGNATSDLTSNIAILSGEFTKAAEEEEDDFDAAFDALAQESITKTKLEELEKEFENDDIFDTSKADKVLKLASLLDKVEEPKEEEEQVQIDFEDPFDTSAYDHITGEVETELEFESLANREASAENADDQVVPADGASGSVFDDIPSSSGQTDGWAAFGADGNFATPEEGGTKKKPPRPAPPAPRRPPPPPAVRLSPGSRPETPSVVVKAPSTDSIKSWNCNVADVLIKKSQKLEADEALLEEEQEEEYDPFDTSNVNDPSITNFEDPFDTSAVKGILGEPESEEEEERVPTPHVPGKDPEPESETDSNPEEEVPDPFDVLTTFDKDGQEIKVLPIKPESKDITAPEADPFDTTIAADVLPNKGDPFDTSFVKGDPGKAEIKALEEEFLNDTTPVSTQGVPRPKGGAAADLSVIVPETEIEEDDPFDTSIVDKVIPVRRAQKSPEVTKEDDEFDPTKSFQRSVSETKQAQEKKEIEKEQVQEQPQEKLPPGVLPRPPTKAQVKKAESIDSDDFDPRA